MLQVIKDKQEMMEALNVVQMEAVEEYIRVLTGICKHMHEELNKYHKPAASSAWNGPGPPAAVSEKAEPRSDSPRLSKKRQEWPQFAENGFPAPGSGGSDVSGVRRADLSKGRSQKQREEASRQFGHEYGTI